MKKRKSFSVSPEVLKTRSDVQVKANNPNELKFKELLEYWDVTYEYQAVFPPYILDFYLPESHICIEIDGKYHETPAQKAYDRKRDRWCWSKGVKTLRIPAKDLFNEEKMISFAYRLTSYIYNQFWVKVSNAAIPPTKEVKTSVASSPLRPVPPIPLLDDPDVW